MKNRIKKNNRPDFDKIQQTLAAEWLEKSNGEKPDASDKDKTTEEKDPAV